MRVLLVEDQADLARLLVAELAGHGMVVDRTCRLDEASAAMQLVQYDLVLLDRKLPDGDGIALLPELRTAQPKAAVLVLSAMGAAADKVAGLDAGADDYLPKPFDWDELRARIRAMLRRPRTADAAPPVTCGNIVYQPDSRTLTVGGNVVQLRRRELLILDCLMSRVRRVVTRELLVERVYGFGEEPTSNTLEAHVSRLRKRLVVLGAGVAIHPIRGIGYLLDETPARPR